MHWVVESPIGTSSSFMHFILANKRSNTRLKFVDEQDFIAGGTLKIFVKGSGDIDKDKGVFQYEAITNANNGEELSMIEAFSHEVFFSSLHQDKQITDEYYEQFIMGAMNYAN